MNKWLAVLTLSATFFGCGLGGSQSNGNPQPALRTSQSDLCSDVPQPNSDGTMTMRGCSFEQHLWNIQNHGTKLAAGSQLQDSAGNQLSATYRCGNYVLGLDSKDIDVVVDTTKATLQSHGQIHPGMSTSLLPTQLVTPLSVP